jgi:hypothetical protein
MSLLEKHGYYYPPEKQAEERLLSLHGEVLNALKALKR